MSEIDLDTCKFRGGPHAFMSFMEKFLDSSSRVEKPCLHKVKLTTVEDDFTRWIDFVATPELEHLDFECKPVVSGTLMPLRLYTCSPKLRHLRLHGVFLGSTSVSLPCLKTMRLENNTYADEACLELLISSCPLLEDFSFVRMPGSCGVNVLRVHSKTLTSLSIETGVHDYDFQNNDRISVKVLINAPRLKYLNLCDFISECKTISNVGSLTKVNLGRYCDNVPDHFFTGISEVRDMKIAGSAFRIASTFGGLPAEMKLVRYFAENSVVLKKLSLRLKSSMDEQDSVALRDILLALPTLSSACEIVVC
ncbi:unnamed protein product [Brassica oleracea var. botrytis]|uniref:FBD domain-containing protein n=2 Tax=Brassica oleracea TaxID=3712 RepID=A0A0D3A2N4_BRAOL|nr:PREDICTED: putative FBD-associated F-box protein At5g22720 [Brassica oleracea var. oleracea]VDD48277.1 unnamed protein product [Brassica oleracea]